MVSGRWRSVGDGARVFSRTSPLPSLSNQLLEAAAGVKGTPQEVKEQLDAAKAQNLNTIRAFAFGTQEGFALQPRIGEYNEDAFKALDFILDEASKRDLRLVLAIANQWDSANTAPEKLQWANTDNKFAYSNSTGKLKMVNGKVTGEDAFFTDPDVRKKYRDHVGVLVNRVNSINGRKYKDDPTIMAWNLINEPRCEQPAGCGMQEWVEEMSSAVKKADPNHLVTIGADGFYGAASCLADRYNPFLWAGHTGSDFLPNHAAKDIDYAAIHLWPDNWQRWDLPFGKDWIDGHIAGARALGKPLVLEEFGKAVGGLASSDQTEADRAKWFNQTYSQLRESVEARDALKGVLFWRWAAVGGGSAALSDFDKSATIETSSDAFQKSVRPFSDFVKTHNAIVCGPKKGKDAPKKEAAAPKKAEEAPKAVPKAAPKATPAPTPAAAAGAAAPPADGKKGWASDVAAPVEAIQVTPVTGGSVASASVPAPLPRRRLAAAGPPPSFFAPPRPSDAGTGCNAQYGRSDGAAARVITTNGIADCCSEAKAGSYSAWSYCYCDLGCKDAANATIAKGSCQLKNPANAFYPRMTALGSGVGWVSGAPGAASLESWKCQVRGAGGGCSPNADPATCKADELKAALKCPADGCHAKQMNMDGDLLVFDINSFQQEPSILTASDCCDACKANGECTGWTFCPLKEGCAKDCQTYIKSGPAKGFGPYGSCNGDAFPYRACSLKKMPEGKHTVTAWGPQQPWVSGTTSADGVPKMIGE